jgi:long-chain fatty acid transport protein
MSSKTITAGGIAVMLAVALLSSGAHATNGMNLEGYGPISVGMGGASFAFFNGTAAVMNNPATLGLLTKGMRLDLALGSLGPDIEATVMTPSGPVAAASLSEAFYMPALGFAMRKDAFVFGIGVFSQGGMGTEYGRSSWMADPSMGANTALDNGLVNRSEVGVGRVIVPFTYDASERLIIGGTADFVWAGIDLEMAMSEAQFQNLANPAAQTLGTASGTLVGAFGQLYEPFGGTGISKLYHAYFDFSNSSSFTGEARGYGVAGKIGAVYRVNDRLSIGGTYHSATSIGDIKTENAKLNMGVNIDPGVLAGAPSGSYEDMNIPVSGTLAVKDFQWPAMLGVGAAFKPVARVMLALDVKYVFWSSAIEKFAMTFTADESAANGPFAGLALDATLFQKWENQAVIAFGGAFEATDALTVRAGYNYGKNPVPDAYLNALFPAIVENHVTFGAGYRVTEAISGDFSFVYAFTKDATNPGNGSTIPPVESEHGQLNWTLMLGLGF